MSRHRRLLPDKRSAALEVMEVIAASEGGKDHLNMSKNSSEWVVQGCSREGHKDCVVCQKCQKHNEESIPKEPTKVYCHGSRLL
jgi:hypothetical protein